MFTFLLALTLVAGNALPAGASAPPLALAADAAIAAFSGTAGVVITDPRTGATYEHESDRIFPSASLYKLIVMADAYRQASGGGLSLDSATVTIADEDLAEGGWTASGVTLSVRAAVERMITLSDNSAGRALLRLLDPHTVNAMARSLGLNDTRINFTLPEDERTADYNTTTARDIARFFGAIAQGQVVDPLASFEMMATLGRQRINDRLPTGLPDGTTIAHKTGNLDGVAHDAGVMTTRFGPRVIVMLTESYVNYDDVVTLAASLAGDAVELSLDRFAAKVTPVDISTVAPGQPFTATIQVTNTSTFAWDGTTFHLAAHWRDTTGAYVRWDGARAAMPPLTPGQSARVSFRGVAPAVSGPFAVLELDVVHEGVDWAGVPAVLPVVFTR